jgi:acyl transferase domain-containing protein
VARDFRPQAERQRHAESLLARCASGDEAQLREALGALAELYCQGYVPAAAPLPRGARPRLASLPSYPFLRSRHWVRPVGGGTQRMPLAPVSPQVEPSSATDQDQAAHETLLLLPVWDAADPKDSAERGGTRSARGPSLLVAGATARGIRAVLEIDPEALVLEPDDLHSEEAAMRRLRGRPAITDVVWLVPPSGAPVPGDAAIADQERGVLAGFRLIKALLGLGHGERPLNLSVVTVRAQAIGPGDAVDAIHASVHGLIGSVAKERPHWRIRLADLPDVDAVPLARVLSLPADRRGQAWVYRHGQWYRRHLAPVRAQGGFRAPYRQRGVYIVIGGAGDIGEAWSEHLIRHHQAQVVWVGRREPDAAIEARLARLARLGPAPEYFAADATHREALQAVRDAVLARHGAVHGVVHAAMVFANQALSAMSEQQFRSALGAKVDVSVRIAQVFGQDDLDFLLFFSSMISLIKNPRQAHYAAGCAFKDAFALQLAQHVSCPVKVVNWGYWAMKKNADAGEVRLLTELGIGLIEPEDGMKALDVLLGSSLRQLGVMRAARALEVEGMDTEETVDVYPLNLEAGMAA